MSKLIENRDFGGIGVYTDMDQWIDIRRKVLVDGVSRREIIRQSGMHWSTLNKILSHSQPPGYRRTRPAKKSKLEAYLPRIRQIIESDKEVPKKQRHTSKRIYERLCEEGFLGGYTIVKEAVREIKRSGKEVFMPLSQKPGKGQVDFGYALANIGGVLQKIVFFVMALPYSDAFFVMAFPRECTETFWAGHVGAFRFFGFVPADMLYDNAKVQVASITGPRKRDLTSGFKQLISHYLFTPKFCLVRRANEKGVVEGIVGYSRQNFLVPVPQVESFDELNEYLEECCRNDLTRKLRGKDSTKLQLLEEDKAAGLPLPDNDFDGCHKKSTFASSLSLIRYDNNDYSVPVDCAHKSIVINADWKSIKLFCNQKLVAQHERCWKKEQQIFNPVHYLRLLQSKPGSLNYSRPLEDLNLPQCFEDLHRVQVAKYKDGQRQFIAVLRLLENHSIDHVAAAIRRAIKQRIYCSDAIAQLLPNSMPWEQTTFRLDGREHLRFVKVADNDVASYRQLLCGGAV